MKSPSVCFLSGSDCSASFTLSSSRMLLMLNCKACSACFTHTKQMPMHMKSREWFSSIFASFCLVCRIGHYSRHQPPWVFYQLHPKLLSLKFREISASCQRPVGPICAHEFRPTPGAPPEVRSEAIGCAPPRSG